jgi:uncharacterized protein YciI
MFALITRYTRPLEEVEQHLEGHVAWIAVHADAGRILLTARQVPREGGLILASAESRERVEEMIRADPFVTAGVAEYEILELEVRRTAPGLERLLEA